MTLPDLFSHATQGTCPIYIKATGLKGVNPSAYSHPSSHNLYEVVGIGYQRLYTPEIYSQAGVQHVELCGDTRSAQSTGLDPELLRSTTWEAKVDPLQFPPFFRGSDIKSLSNEISGNTAAVPSNKSQLLVVGALLELMTETGRMNKESIQKEILRKYEKKVRGLGSRNLQEIFARSTEALEDAIKA